MIFKVVSGLGVGGGSGLLVHGTDAGFSGELFSAGDFAGVPVLIVFVGGVLLFGAGLRRYSFNIEAQKKLTNLI